MITAMLIFFGIFIFLTVAGMIFAAIDNSTIDQPKKIEKPSRLRRKNAELREEKRTLQLAIDDFIRENRDLKAENAALRLGLPYPTIEQSQKDHEEALEKVKESIRQEYPDIEFK